MTQSPRRRHRVLSLLALTGVATIAMPAIASAEAATHASEHLATTATTTTSAAATADIETERVSYQFQGDPFYGWIVSDPTLPGPRPAVIIFHEWWGLDEFALEQARTIAELGYIVFCADMFGMDESGDNIVAETPEEAQRRSGRLYRDRVWMRQLATAAYMQVVKRTDVDPSRVAAIGFGFGGTVGVELARSGVQIRGTVCFHGGLHNPNPSDASRVRGEILVLQGTQDPMVTDEEIDAFEQEMDAARRPFQVVRISGAEHAFSNRRSDFWNIGGASYDERAAEIAATHVASFLDRVLDGPGAGERRADD